MNGRLVAAGAVLGGVVALAITLAFDPAEGTGSGAYEGGARFGEMFRYVLLGAACGGCVERLRSGARGGLLWGAGALVAAALVIGPAIHTASEGTPAERLDDQARIDFIAGCTDTSRASGAPEHLIRPYCECMYSAVARSGRIDEIARMADSGASPPRWITEIAERAHPLDRDANMCSCRMSSSTATPPTPSWTARRIRWSWPRLRPSRAMKRLR